ncbi:hypothetical protein M885DRAFT_505777 [Pelagophyceae sp. CCMP2097]|nr:hypothetical protein M885DRAFT_505777 [Pelagophyceae sp. CCMP2097]
MAEGPSLVDRLQSLGERTEEWASLRRPCGRSAEAQEHPLSAVARRIGSKRAARFEKLVQMLAKVPIFEKMTRAQLNRAVGQLTREHAAEGDVIMQQGALGDAFYALTAGEAVVLHQKGGHARATVQAVRVLATLKAPSYFGESGVVSGERRDATVVAGRGGAGLLRLSRDAFLALADDEGADGAALAAARDMARGCLLFASLRPNQTRQVLKRMKLCAFREHEFVVEAGEVGANVYVVVSGACGAAAADGGGAAADAAFFGPGAHFGERALRRKASKAAVVARAGGVTCLRLPHDAFHPDLSHLLKLMLPEARRPSNDVGAHATGALLALSSLARKDWRQRLCLLAHEIIAANRGTTYRALFQDLVPDAVDGQAAAPTAKPALSRTPSVSQAVSAARRSRGDLTGLVVPRPSAEAKRDAAALARVAGDLRSLEAVQGLSHLAAHGARALAKLPYRRSHVDMAIVRGLVSRHRALGKLCSAPAATASGQASPSQASRSPATKVPGQALSGGLNFERSKKEFPGWSEAQVSSLCRSLKFERCAPLRVVFEQGGAGFKAYAILSGLVRLRRWTFTPDSPHFGDVSKIAGPLDDDAIEEDVETLGPGDVLGGEVFESQVASVRTSLAITGSICDFAVIEIADYFRAAAIRDEMVLEDKVAVLRKAALFRQWDVYRLNRLAYAMVEKRYPKDYVLAIEGNQAHALACIVSGTAILRISPDAPHTRIAADVAANEQRRNAARAAAADLPCLFPAQLVAAASPGGDGSPAVPHPAQQLFGRKPIKLLTIGAGDYFGDSGAINFNAPESKKKRSNGRCVELHSTAVASAELVTLELAVADCALLDEADVRALVDNRALRHAWRHRRLATLARTACGRGSQESPTPFHASRTASASAPALLSPRRRSHDARPNTAGPADAFPSETLTSAFSTSALSSGTAPQSTLPQRAEEKPALLGVPPTMISRAGLAHALVEGGSSPGTDAARPAVEARQSSLDAPTLLPRPYAPAAEARRLSLGAPTNMLPRPYATAPRATTAGPARLGAPPEGAAAPRPGVARPAMGAWHGDEASLATSMDCRNSRKLAQYQNVFSNVAAAQAASSGRALGLAASLATSVAPPRHWFAAQGRA